MTQMLKTIARTVFVLKFQFVTHLNFVLRQEIYLEEIISPFRKNLVF